MVTRRYLLEKPRGPSAAIRYLHWNAVPAIINGLGAIEGLLEQVAAAVRQSPARPLGAAFVMGVVLARGSRKKRPP